MNLIPTAPSWLLIIMGLLLAAAAVEDAVRLRISNLSCLGVMLGALLAMVLAGFELSLWQNAVNFLALLAVGTMVFAAGKLGGGDVKLLAALGLWFNFGGAIWLITAVFLAGGLIALLFIIVRLFRGGGLGRKNQGGMIPYGLAIVAGALFVAAAQLGVGSETPEKPDPLRIRPLS